MDIERIRADFPILKRQIKPGIPLVYLDSAASSQKPSAVIDAMSEYYRNHHANIHRAVHTLAEEATGMYEAARAKIAACIAAQPEEIVFTRNATEAINLVAQSWGRTHLKAGDRILLSEMEHHSNLVPWQILAKDRDLQLDFIPLTGSGELDLDACETLLGRGPKLVALTQMSNVLGTIVPIREIVRSAHRAGARLLVDAAQAASHMAIDVLDLDADFMAISSHKMCGPTGIGALYGKTEVLRDMPPFLGGGDMIRKVDWRSFEPNDLPYIFEAGTPAIAEAVGWGAAVDYLTAIGFEAIHRHETDIAAYAMESLREMPGLTVLGPEPSKRGGVVSFTLEGIHPHDIAQILDSYGIAVRAGHHCAMPLHTRLGLSATTRASFYLYSTFEEVDALAAGLRKVRAIFA
ncbi:MAG: cysteine desulfurase [Anaerolineales bacterium]|nr:cysteine desulfurase [Anaerolineales bacterium]